MSDPRFARSVATLGQLRIYATGLGIAGLTNLRRRDLVQRIVEAERDEHRKALRVLAALKEADRATA